MIIYDDLDKLDRGSFKAFAMAAKTLNFTLAAERAAMTQSGVSQHVARLENQLGTQLFLRINKKVALTEAGRILLEFIEGERERTGKLFESVQGEVGRLSGLVRYGMPHSCLFTNHFPILLQKRKKFPQINLEVQLIPNEIIFERLLARRIDFGFVTKRHANPAILFELFAREEYVLVGRDRNLLRAPDRESILNNLFVSYPGFDVLFDLWAGHYLGGRASHESLQIAGSIDSLHGAITMLENGVGLSVLPRHCVADRLKAGILFEGPKLGKKPLQNEIHIVTLDGVHQPRRVLAVLDAFWEITQAPLRERGG